MSAPSAASAGPRPPRKIRTRILLAFVLSLIASATALGHSLLQLDAIGRNVSMLDRGYLPLARVAAELEAIARQMDREHDRLTRSPPKSSRSGQRGSQSISTTSAAPRHVRRSVMAPEARRA